jgi:hypothetical protein
MRNEMDRRCSRGGSWIPSILPVDVFIVLSFHRNILPTNDVGRTMILTTLVQCSTSSVMLWTAAIPLYIYYHIAAVVHNIFATNMSIDKTTIIRYSVQYRTWNPNLVTLKRHCLNLSGIIVLNRDLSGVIGLL